MVRHVLSSLCVFIHWDINRKEPAAKSHLAISNGGNGNGSGRPVTPVEMKRSPTHRRVNGRTKVISGTKREPFVQLHPKGQSPSHQIPNRYFYFLLIMHSR